MDLPAWCHLLAVVEVSSCFELSVVAEPDEVLQPVNAKRMKTARDAAITFFNFIEFVLLVLFFMIFNLLLNII